MPFGAGTNLSENQNHSVNPVEKLNGNGDIVQFFTNGGKQTKTEEFYSSSFTNAAVNGQAGTAVVSEHNLIKVNNDYVKEQKTTITALSTSGGLTTAS
jgi:hypothetical protein